MKVEVVQKAKGPVRPLGCPWLIDVPPEGER